MCLYRTPESPKCSFSVKAAGLRLAVHRDEDRKMSSAAGAIVPGDLGLSCWNSKMMGAML